jgi:2-hydroxychromene-2-carboxylate isomerase
MAGSSTADAPAFFFDLASPAAYVAAERALERHPGVEWVPVLARDLPGAESWEAFRCAEERDIALAQIERTAAECGLQPLRWPDPFPFDSLFAMRVATYAKQIGRGVAFSLAAFRQAFAGGRDLADAETILIAAAACEMRPAAVLKAAELQSVRAGLESAVGRAAAAGVTEVPALVVGGSVFQGPRAPEEAADALAGEAVTA